MIVGKVIGTVWATRKEDKLSGLKLLVIKPIDYLDENATSTPIIAADIIGAGVGERVIIVTGSSARSAVGDMQIPVDATVVAIIDDEDIKV